MINFRPATIQDIEQIQEIEREYYEGFNCLKETLKNWIQNLSNNFIIAEDNNKIIGFIFFEYLNEIKAIPFIHTLQHNSKGKYVYISEVGISNDSQNSDILQKLFIKLLEKSKKDNCKAVIWLTGSKAKHDKIESQMLINNNFIKKQNIKNWEAYPNHFVNDHYLWIKEI